MAPKWNFHKHLVNREGHLIDCFHSNTPPKNEKAEKTMENALGKHIARETL
jgi:glutathione peroxidase